MTKEQLINYARENPVVMNAIRYGEENGLPWEHIKNIIIEMLINENDALRSRVEDYYQTYIMEGT